MICFTFVHLLSKFIRIILKKTVVRWRKVPHLNVYRNNINIFFAYIYILFFIYILEVHMEVMCLLPYIRRFICVCVWCDKMCSFAWNSNETVKTVIKSTASFNKTKLQDIHCQGRNTITMQFERKMKRKLSFNK